MAARAAAKAGGALGLRDFMHRSQVLSQYRQFLRLVAVLDGPQLHRARQGELWREVAAAFRNAELNDAGDKARRELLQEGERQLAVLANIAAAKGAGFRPQPQHDAHDGNGHGHGHGDAPAAGEPVWPWNR